MKVNLSKRLNRQKDFNIDPTRFKRLSGSSFLDSCQVYDNSNLSIHVTDKCNADCAFCIAHLRYLNDGNVYIKPEIEDDEIYFQRLDEVLSSLKSINPSVSITGGEPTVNRKLPRILDILMKHHVRKRTITTNGSGLHYRIEGGKKTVLEKLGDYQLEHLNISRAHYDTHKNAHLMTINEKLMSNQMLKEAIIEAKKYGMQIRLSCALLKDGINNYDEMMRYIDWAYNIGADNIIFRQLMKFNEEKIQPGRIPIFCKEQEIDLVPIWNQFDSDDRFSFYHQVLGYYYYVEVRELNTWKGQIVDRKINVVSEMADLRMINPQLDKYSKELGERAVFEMIFHPNGNLCAGWNENEQVMSTMEHS